MKPRRVNWDTAARRLVVAFRERSAEAPVGQNVDQEAADELGRFEFKCHPTEVSRSCSSYAVA